MRVYGLVPIFAIIWKLSLAQSQASGEFEHFSCYKCETSLDEEDTCNTIDDTCLYQKCAKIKYKDDNKIKIIRECAPTDDVIEDEICHQAQQLKGKPCDAWLCGEPLCNGAEPLMPRAAVGVNCATQTLISTIVLLVYFLVYG